MYIHIIIGCRMFTNFLSQWAIYISSLVFSQFLLFGLFIINDHKGSFCFTNINPCVLHMLNIFPLCFFYFMVTFIVKTLLILHKLSVYLGGWLLDLGSGLCLSLPKTTKIIFVLFSTSWSTLLCLILWTSWNLVSSMLWDKNKVLSSSQ